MFKLYKKGNKVETIEKGEVFPRPFSTFQLFKLSQLCYNFVKSFENNNFFSNCPSYPPPYAVQNSLTNKFNQKNLGFLIFSTKK